MPGMVSKCPTAWIERATIKCVPKKAKTNNNWWRHDGFSMHCFGYFNSFSSYGSLINAAV
jgi:hypothetical protein